jgi:bacillithiol system protein YtxJ
VIDSRGPVAEAIAVRGVPEIERALAEPLAVVYKHSPLCGLSDMAAREVRSFMADHPDVPVYIVDVIRDRGASREVERRLSVRHESPQAFVLVGGGVVWHGSHRAVTEASLAAGAANGFGEGPETSGG